jgi:hypothetical protein
MEDLRIEDGDGDAFTLSEIDGGAYLASDESGVTKIQHTDGVRLVAWLSERFGLTAIGMDPGLEVNVETETGKTRSVRWYGPDVPAELLKVAAYALCVHDHGAELAAALRTGRPEPESLAILRQLMSTLGCERPSVLPARVQGLMQDLDNLAEDIAQMAGVTIGPDGANLRALLDKIKLRHHEAITNLEKSHQRALDAARNDCRRQAREHHTFRESVPMQIEQALSTERNARAAVRAELDERVKENLELRRQLRAADLLRKQQDAAMDEVREALRRAGADDEHLPLRVQVQELAKARDLNAGAAASFAGKLEKAREVLADMRAELSGGTDDTPNAGSDGYVQVENRVIGVWFKRITEALKVSDPGA